MTNHTQSVINQLALQWINGFSISIEVNNERSKNHPVTTIGTYGISTYRKSYHVTGNNSHDCNSASQCSTNLARYEQAVISGENKNILNKSIDLIKSNIIHSFSLNDNIDSRSHAYVKTCTACHGNGEEQCYDCYGAGQKNCHYCTGGRISCLSCTGSGYHYGANGSQIRCNGCSGSGKSNCYSCHGNGRITCGTCSGRRTLACNACSATGYFTITETSYVMLTGQQSCKWSTDADYPWLDDYINLALNKKIAHALLNETSTWDLLTFSFDNSDSFPLKTSMSGDLKTTTSKVSIESSDPISCWFIGEIYKPFNLGHCFDSYIEKQAEVLVTDFSPETCNVLFNTNIAKDTFEYLNEESLPLNIAYSANLVSPSLGETLKDTLIRVGHLFDNKRKKVSLMSVLLSLIKYLIILMLIVTFVDTLFMQKIDWQAMTSFAFSAALFENIRHGVSMVYFHKVTELLPILIASFIPMLFLRAWLGSHQIWKPGRLFWWYILTTILLATFFIMFDQQNLRMDSESLTFSMDKLVVSARRSILILVDLVMLSGFIAILRVRKSAYKKNKIEVNGIKSPALNRLLNYK